MSTEQNDGLQDLVQRFLTRTSPMTEVRGLMETESGFDAANWAQMSGELGLTAIAIPEAYGGLGLGLTELAIVFEAMGRNLACMPYLSSAVLGAQAILASKDEAAMAQFLPGIASGATRATLATAAAHGEARETVAASRLDGGDWVLTGAVEFVLDGASADLILVTATTSEGISLFAVDGAAAGLTRQTMPSMDMTRKLAALAFSATPARIIGALGEGSAIARSALDYAMVALAAEQVGGAQCCIDMSVDYAKIRYQFGRQIGSFQAIKQKCADMLVAVELARAALALALAAEPGQRFMAQASLAKAICSDAYFKCAADNIQVHGGIGFTWEHDAQLYFRRAKASQAMFGDAAGQRERYAGLVLDGSEAIGDLPDGAAVSKSGSPVYEEALAWLQEHWKPDLTVAAWWRLIADAGWAYPTWPVGRFGRGLPPSAVADVRAAFSEMGALGPPVRAGQKLAAPTLLVHGTEAQKDAFLPGLARGEEQWSQFFSEPDAGSDLAGIRTKAVRDGDDWIISGRKVWSSFAQYSDRGILLARTDWEVPKHKGLTLFVIDLDQPGVEIRPLRQMNGNQEFNEVLFSDVRVTADRVVGEVGNGWRVALTTLSFERFMTVAAVSALPGRKGGFLDAPAADVAAGVLSTPGEGALIGRLAPLALAAARKRNVLGDPVLRQRLAQLDMLEQVFQQMSKRHAAAIASGGAGSGGSLIKLLRSELARLGRDVGLEVLGPFGMVMDAELSGGTLQHFALTSPYASIAGGTDEIQRNIVAERLLGLPKEASTDTDMPFSAVVRAMQTPRS